MTGHWVKKFSEANMAHMVDVHMGGDYAFWYYIKEIKGKKITLEKGFGNEVFTKTIKTSKRGWEYFTVLHTGIYEKLFKGGRPMRIKCLPFKED